MEIQLFNSLGKIITAIKLQPNQTINLYLCGPTVYNHIHVGNLRPVIIFDVLHRLLLSLNIKVNYIQNITDIDDKIIQQAQKEKSTEKKITNHYTKTYLTNLICYNALFPSYFPRVSDYIPAIQKFIGQLIEKNYAYQSEEEILFRVTSKENYGQLSGQNLEKLKEKSRLITIADKLDPKDFIL